MNGRCQESRSVSEISYFVLDLERLMRFAVRLFHLVTRKLAGKPGSLVEYVPYIYRCACPCHRSFSELGKVGYVQCMNRENLVLVKVIFADRYLQSEPLNGESGDPP